MRGSSTPIDRAPADSGRPVPRPLTQMGACRPSAAAVPVRVRPDAVGWSGMVQRPDLIDVGMGGAPIVRRLAWRNWGGPRAWAAGKLDIYWPQPGPISGWHPATYPVTVRLQDILTHNGQPSYRKMADFYPQPPGCRKGAVLQLLRSAGRISPRVGTPATEVEGPGSGTVLIMGGAPA
jgi:hypothetical protein